MKLVLLFFLFQLTGAVCAEETGSPEATIKEANQLMDSAAKGLYSPSEDGLKKAEDAYSTALTKLQGLAAQLEPLRGKAPYDTYLSITGQYLANAAVGLAMVYGRRGDEAAAIKVMEENLGLLERNKDVLSQGHLHKGIAESYHRLQQLQKAKTHYEKALELFASDPKRLDGFIRYARLAYYRCLEEMGDVKGAKAQLDLAVAATEAMPDGEGKQDALKQCLFERAYLSLRQGDRVSAERDLRQMLSLPKVQSSPDDKLSTLLSLFTALSGSDREKEREQILNQADEVLAAGKASGHPVSPMLEETYYMALVTSQALDDPAVALSYIDKIDEIHAASGLGGLSPAFQSRLNVYQSQGRVSELLPQLRSYVDSVKNPTNEDIHLLLTLAKGLADEGEVEEALRRLQALEAELRAGDAKALLLETTLLEADIFAAYDQSDRAGERYQTALNLSQELGKDETTRSIRTSLFQIEIVKPNFLQDKGKVERDFEQLSRDMATDTVGTIELTSLFSSYIKELIEQGNYPAAQQTLALLKNGMGGRSPFVDLYISVMESKLARKMEKTEEGEAEIARLESDLKRTKDVRFQRRILEEIVDWKIFLKKDLKGDKTLTQIAALPGQNEQIGDRLSNLLFDLKIAEYQGDQKEAMQKNLLAERLLLSVRQSGSNQELGSAFITSANVIYQHLVTRLVAEDNYDEAFAAAERGRGVTLTSLFSRARADLAAGATAPERRELDRLYSQRESQEKLLASQSGEAADTTMSKLVSTASQIDELLTAIAARNGRRDKLFLETVTADFIKEKLAPGQALVRFFTTDEHSFAFLLSRGTQTQVAELPNNDKLMDQVREYRKAIQLQSPQAKQLAAVLSETLFGGLPGLESYQDIVVVPDGPLFLLPYAPLQLKDGKELYFHSLSVLPSARSLSFLKPPRKGADGGDITVFANPRYSVGKGAVAAFGSGTARVSGDGSPIELPGTAREAELVKKLCQPKYKVDLYERSDASRSRLEELNRSGKLEKSRVLHFATHGFTVPENPRLSGLILSLVDDQGQPRNGYLRLLDIYGLNLDADLVVLSACETGKGTIKEGDGLLGLYQGFLTAGGRQVLNTLWSIDDEATAVFFGYFYEALMSGKDAKESLALAQQKMATSAKWRSPYYWAAFQLVSR